MACGFNGKPAMILAVCGASDCGIPGVAAAAAGQQPARKHRVIVPTRNRGVQPRPEPDRATARFIATTAEPLKENVMAPQSSFTDGVIDLIPGLRSYARALTRDRTDADDLVQETLTKALRYHERFTEGTLLKAWLFTIMRNTHFTAVKKFTREQPGAIDCVSGDVMVPPVHDMVIAHKETLAAIDRLPVHYREMLTLVVMLEESYESAAAICDCAVGTVKSRVNRARRMVMDDLAYARLPSSCKASKREVTQRKNVDSYLLTRDGRIGP